jgi:hypothetical protein
VDTGRNPSIPRMFCVVVRTMMQSTGVAPAAGSISHLTIFVHSEIGKCLGDGAAVASATAVGRRVSNFSACSTLSLGGDHTR